MDKFYTVTIIVAFVILVIALIGLGILLQNQDAATEFPPKQNQCPDHWTVSGDYCKWGTNNFNFGSLDISAGLYGKIYSISGDYVEPSTGLDGIKFRSNVLRCDKKKWANSNGIIWDGISNYNQC
jgi:hypothetical protein